jgi:murein DD-endopeptidase MepM/ murein hydrolase activator NlpD
LTKNKKYSTIVIFDKSQSDPQTITVRSKHLSRWKSYVIMALIFVAFLLVILIFYAKQAAKNEKAAQILEKYQKEVLKPLAIDTNFAKEYIHKIDVKLKKLERYLEQRGVKMDEKMEFAREKKPSKQAIQTYIQYNKKVSEVFKKVQNTPLGFPVLKHISSGYGYRSNPFGKRGAVFHHGIDIDGKSGDRVNATASGTVVLASWNSGYGNCVIVKHDTKYSTLYGHLSKISVRKGQHIVAGQKVGLVGSTGHSTGDHLHYEIHKGEKECNPMNFLNI